MSFFKFKPGLLKTVTFVLVLFVVTNNIIFLPNNIFSWDVFGYYLYLPLKFIYHDLGLHNNAIISDILNKYHNTGTFYQGLQMPDGHYVMKYSMGLSIFYAPFFFIGHLIAYVFHFPTDGFSAPYQYSVFAGCIFYTILGILVLSKVLLRFFSEKIAALCLVILVLGTNFIIHNTMYGQNALAHNILFTTYALILWFTILWHETFKPKYAILLAIFCGLTILSRPSDIVCLIIPFLWGVKNKETAIEKVKLLLRYKYQIFIFGATLIAIGSVQFIYWKIYTGKFLYYSYNGNAGEGFEFRTPYILNVLFSFRKGWLVYTPIMFFSIIGLLHLYKRNKTIFFAVFIYFLCNLYIVSSWSCWWYAQSFGQRPLIQSYTLLLLPLGYFLSWLNEKGLIIRYTLYTVIILLMSLNIFQTVQIHKGVIDGDRMTKDYYFAVFGKIHVNDEQRKLLLVERSAVAGENFKNESDYESKLLTKIDFENNKYDSTIVHSGKYSFKLDSSNMYSPAVEKPYKELTKKDHVWVRVSAWIYPVKDVKNNPFSLVVHFTHNGYAYKYNCLDSEKMTLEINKWNRIVFDYLTPEVRRQTDELKIYFWMRGKNTVYIDDMQVDIFERK